MAKKEIRQVNHYSGKGTLLFENNESVPVTYRIDEFHEFSDGVAGLKQLRGTVSHTQGHPHWHPMALVEQITPLTLVMGDGRKLKVLFENTAGSVRGTGGFF